VLAAGASSRFGSPKQLVEVEGEPLVRKSAKAALAAGATHVFVVLGASARRIAPALENVAGVSAIENANWQSGLSSSLAVGLRAVIDLTTADGALVTLADQALIDGSALALLVAGFDATHRVVASSYDGVIGVPALFGREFLEELTTFHGDAGAGAWLRAHAAIVTKVPLAIASLDIDTPHDASRVR